MVTQSTTASQTGAASIHSARVLKRPSPLLTVLRWELRRAFASRATWIIAVPLFVVLLLLLSFSLLQQHILLVPATQVTVTRHSLFGLAMILPISVLEFALVLPFVTADGVSLDLRRRTHELLMTTALPTRAYVWGRYLASMLIALGMACVYLLALLVISVALHLHAGNYYPALNLPGALVVWAVVVLPPTLLLSSLCFALGVLLPKLPNQIKAGAVVAWFMIGLVLQAFVYEQVRDGAGFAVGNPPAWWTAYETWQPTNTDAGHLFTEQFLQRLSAIVNNGALSSQTIQQRVDALKGQMPDPGSFAAAHLIWVVMGVAAVVGASFAFRRFRGVLA
jgi:hypothetical protein